jgi:hypothetical protein
MSIIITFQKQKNIIFHQIMKIICLKLKMYLEEKPATFASVPLQMDASEAWLEQQHLHGPLLTAASAE